MTRATANPLRTHAKRRSAARAARRTGNDSVSLRDAPSGRNHAGAAKRVRTLQCAPFDESAPQQQPVVSLSGGLLRALGKTHGGKTYLCQRILDRVPPGCDAFLDLFGGGGVMTLNAPCASRHYNDADALKVNFHQCIQAYPEAMIRRLSQIPYTEASFEKFKAISAAHRDAFQPGDLLGNAEAKINRAVAWYVRNKMSRGGLGKDFAWSDRLRGGQPGDVNAWENSICLIPRVSARLQGVSITCRHFRNALKWMPAGRVVIYADPPYVHSTRTATNAYEVEMSDDEHLELLTLLGLKAIEEVHSVLISGYANAMYDRVLDGWQRIKFSMPNHAGQGKTKQRRTEILWASPKAWRR